jgi:hypothetical protein
MRIILSQTWNPPEKKNKLAMKSSLGYYLNQFASLQGITSVRHPAIRNHPEENDEKIQPVHMDHPWNRHCLPPLQHDLLHHGQDLDPRVLRLLP